MTKRKWGLGFLGVITGDSGGWRDMRLGPIIRTVFAALILLTPLSVGHAFYGKASPPPHLAKRLPPVSSIPANVMAEQRQAIELVYSWDPKTRAMGAQAMVRLRVPPEVAIPYLIALLADYPENQRDYDPEEADFRVLKRLGFKPFSEDVSADCLVYLAAMGEPTVKALAKLLKEEKDPEVGRRMLMVLADIAHAHRPGPVFAKAADGSEKAVPQRAWTMDEGAVNLMLEAFQQGDLAVRRSALRYLQELMSTRGTWGGVPPAQNGIAGLDDAKGGSAPLARKYLDALIAAARDPSHTMRAAALIALAETGRAEAVTCLINAVADDSHVVRSWVVHMLANKGRPLEHRGEDSRWEQSAPPLPNLGKDPRVIEAMIVALENEVRSVHADAHPAVISAAHGALVGFTGKDFGEDAKKWREWWEANKATFKGPPAAPKADVPPAP